MSFEPSKYQRAIFEFVRGGAGNAIIQAVAGSGKTTTIVEALRYTSGNVLFCAFNKAIVNELEARVPRHVKVKTLHSIGYGILRRNIEAKTFRVDNDKLRGIVRQVLDADDNRSRGYGVSSRGQEALVMRLVGLCQSCLLLGTPDDIDWVADHYDVDTNSASLDTLSDWVQEVIQRSTKLADQGVVDFNDMIYMPALRLGKGWRAWTYDWIFVDEAQDLSTAQRIILEHMLAPNGRLVAVGDEAQSIYGFRGADVDSMPKLKEHFGCAELPLSVCYRCPAGHVDLAKALVPQIEAAPNAQPGTIATISPAQLVDTLQSGDLVMCRRNAPLIGHALAVIAAGKKAVVKGRDIGTGLINLVRKMDVASIDEFLPALDRYVGREVRRLREREKEAQAQSLEDRRDCLYILARGLDTTRELVAQIERVFSDDVYGIVFSSVHRAKGLEADNTYILEYERMPMRWRGQRDWQYRQEVNIQYVALTRAKKALHFVVGDAGQSATEGEAQQ